MRVNGRVRAQAGLVLCLGLTALLLRWGAATLPPWPGSPNEIGGWLRGTPPDLAVAALAGVLATLLASWLAGSLVACLVAALPGAAGRTGRTLATRLAPAAVRRLVESALGVSLAAGLVGTTAAGAAAATPTAGPVAPPWPSLDRLPAIAAPVARPKRPTGPPPVSARPAYVLVRPGDSLWRIAERALGPTAGMGQIAATWPRWYAANRVVIGPDPDLLHPGQRLRPPADRHPGHEGESS